MQVQRRARVLEPLPIPTLSYYKSTTALRRVLKRLHEGSSKYAKSTVIVQPSHVVVNIMSPVKVAKDAHIVQHTSKVWRDALPIQPALYIFLAVLFVAFLGMRAFPIR